MRTAVLGAGVTGLTAARRLHDMGETVVVYESEEKIGGLARSRSVNGYLYDPHGGHILNSKDPKIMEWVFSILPKENWKHTVRNAKIFFKGGYVSYPFELSLCELDTETQLDCVCDFMEAERGEEPDNFKDWLIWHFGKGIAENYMIPYNSKIWAYPLEDMEVGWMHGKMPLPEKKEVLRSLVMKDPTERKMPHSTFYYPLKGGIQTMVNAIAEPLDVRLNHRVKECVKKEGKWYVDGEMYDRVICTVSLPELRKIMDLPKDVNDAIGGLKYNSLTTVLFNCPSTEITWLYIPSSDYRSHRVGYQSALTPFACPGKGGCGALEIIGPQFKVTDSIKDAIPKELYPNEIMDHEFTEYAYVIHDKDYRKNTEKVFSHFDEFDDFFLVGRWACWNYNNMDICMGDAFRLIDRIRGAE
jgi:Protoporphyrinogen oxidase